jgi:large subunit ribosomal protein L32e
MSKDFKRQDISRFIKIGRNSRKPKWRCPKGRHSKMRRKRKSYPSLPTVGHRTPKEDSGKINGFVPIQVYNIKDLEKVSKDSIVILAKVGMKKKMEIIKEAEQRKIRLLNVRGMPK